MKLEVSGPEVLISRYFGFGLLYHCFLPVAMRGLLADRRSEFSDRLAGWVVVLPVQRAIANPSCSNLQVVPSIYLEQTIISVLSVSIR